MKLDNKSKKDYAQLKLEFYAEMDCCGLSPTEVAIKIGIPDRTGRQWAKERVLKEELNDKKSPVKVLDSIRTGSVVYNARSGSTRKHMVIPDTQVKPGQDFTFFTHIGKYIVEKQPDVIVCIGDFGDMPSLSSYDKGKKSFEGRRYKHDIKAVRDAMNALMAPIYEYNRQQREKGLPEYNPEKHLTQGNHEWRIIRAIESNPELDGLLSLKDLGYEEHGWIVHGFLEVIVIDGVAYSHYFTGGVMGRPVASARALLTKKHMSCVMGHVQFDEIATQYDAAGRRMTGLFVGCCYEHDEDYLGPQGNNYWRGLWMLHEVHDGEFEPMQVSLKYLRNKFLNN